MGRSCNISRGVRWILSRYRGPIWPLQLRMAPRLFCLELVICLAGSHVYCAQQSERTHVERFAPQAQKLRLAEQKAEESVRKDPSDADALLNLGLARLRVERVDDAIAAFRQAAALAPSLAAAQSDLAYAFWMRGQYQDALQAARTALLLDPRDAAAHRYAGRLLLMEGGDRKEAIAHLEKAAQLNPEETDAHFDLLMAYRVAGNLPNAWAQLRLLQTEFPDNDPRLLYVHGLLVSDQGRSALAIDLFRQAWKGNPNLEEARDALGIELAQARRWKEALDVLGPARQVKPRSFRVTYAYALALLNTQHFEEAETEAQRAISLNPASKEGHALLGQIQARMARGGNNP
jgi:tetratricopeptide (TPR) repeat protein